MRKQIQTDMNNALIRLTTNTVPRMTAAIKAEDQGETMEIDDPAVVATFPYESGRASIGTITLSHSDALGGSAVNILPSNHETGSKIAAAAAMTTTSAVTISNIPYAPYANRIVFEAKTKMAKNPEANTSRHGD
jgi:hypothetical protein